MANPTSVDTLLPVDVRLMVLLTSVLGWTAVALVLLAVGTWAVRHPVWTVHTLEVHGDLQHQSEEVFRTHIQDRLHGSFLTIDLNEVKAVFETVPWVRKAVVKRAFPNRIRVTLEEHQAVAFWDQGGDLSLINRQGEVFEANAENENTEALPELAGPAGQTARVKALYELLVPELAVLDRELQRLELTAQGSWRATLDNGADLELGRGEPPDVLARVRLFSSTIGQVTRQHAGRDLETADLRYPAAYAVKLRGVATLEPGQLPASAIRRH